MNNLYPNLVPRQFILIAGASLTLLAYFPGSAFAATSNEKPLEARVARVTVYPDRALITRVGKTSLEPGEHEVAFGGLPSGIDEASIRARGTGAGLKILGVQVKRDFVESAEPDAVNKLNDAIEKLQQANQDLSDEQRDINQKRSLLEKLSAQAGQPGKDASPAIPVADIKALVDYYGTEQNALSTRLRQIERTTHLNNKELNRLRQQLATLHGRQSPKTRKVVVTVRASRPVSATLEVDYLVHGAGWVPQYDVVAGAGAGDIELTSYGLVRQSTGEDWNGIALTFSTARPQQSTAAPELPVWTLDFLQPPAPAMTMSEVAQLSRDAMPHRSRMDDDSRRSNMESKRLGGDAEPDLMAEPLTSNLQQRGYSAVFSVPGTTDVPSDNQAKRCTISIQKLKSERSYIAVPKLSPAVYVKARVKNADPAPMLPGEVNLFMEGDFIGRSVLPLVPPEGTFDLFLGRDDAIKITRKENVTKENVSGMLNRTRTVRLGYTIELENFRKEDVVVMVKDQIPVSKNSDIRVTADRLKPKPESQNAASGEIEWKLSLPSRKKETIEVTYDVTSPLDRPVSGLE